MLLYRALSSLVLWLIVFGLVFTQSIRGTYLFCFIFALIAQWEFYSLQKQRGIEVFQKTGVFLASCCCSVVLRKDIGVCPLGALWKR